MVSAQRFRLLLWKAWLVFWHAPKSQLFETGLPVLLTFMFQSGGMVQDDTQNDSLPELSTSLVIGLPLATEAAVSSYGWEQFAFSPVYPRDFVTSYGVNWVPFHWKERKQALGEVSVSRVLWTSSNESLVEAAALDSLIDAFSAAPQSFGSIRIPSTLMEKVDYDSTEGIFRDVTFEASLWAVFDVVAGPPDWVVRLKVNGTFAPDTDPDQQEVPPASDREFGKYLDSGAFTLMAYMAQAITNTTFFTKVRALSEVAVAKEEEAPWIFQWLVGWCLNIGTMFWFNSLVGRIVNDRVFGVERGLLLAGVSRLEYCAHWFVASLPATLLIATGHTALGFAANWLHHSSFVLIWAWLLLYLWGLLLVAIVCGGLLGKDSSSAGGLFGTFTLSIGYIPVLAGNAPTELRFLISCLAPWLGVMDGGGLICQHELLGSEQGITFDNAVDLGWHRLLLAQTVCMVLWGGICYLVYRPPSTEKKDLPEELTNSSSMGALESDSSDGEVAVEVSRLCRFFPGRFGSSGGMWAVAGVDLTLRKNEIFGLLGHNGAGKTTTISMMTGELPVNGGRIVYRGSSGTATELTQQSVSRLRPTMGVCPQEDVLFEQLSPLEHLALYSGLKSVQGVNSDRAEWENLLYTCGLGDDKDRPVGSFSGGMKRKMTLSIALLGNPEVVYLDEPTAGMDPVSRRQVWDLILKIRQNRCVVLTTHFMDEADILCNRIGILRDGQIVALGSSLFLKNFYEAGYHLSCLPLEDSSEALPEIRSVLTRAGVACPDLPVDDASASPPAGAAEIMVRLPNSFESTLPDLLRDLAPLTRDVRLSLTSLEDVFLKTAHGDPDPESSEEEAGSVSNGNVTLVNEIWTPTEKASSRVKRIAAAVKVLVKSNVRDRVNLSFDYILPVSFLSVGFVLGYVYGPDIVKSPQEMVFGPHFTDSDSAGGIEGGVLSYSTTIVSALPHLVVQAANTVLQEKGHSLTLIFAPQPFVEPRLVDVTTMLVPMLSGFAYGSLAYVVLTAATWKFRKITVLLQLMGMSRMEQILSMCLWKLIFGFLPMGVLSIGLALAFDSPLVGGGGRWAAFLLLILSYVFAVLPFALMFLPVFPTEKVATDLFPMLWAVITVVPFVLVWIFLNGDNANPDVGNLLGDIMNVFPSLAYQRGVQMLLTLSNREGEVTWADTFAFQNKVTISILVSVGVGVVCSGVVYLQNQTSSKQHAKTEQPSADHAGISAVGLKRAFGSKKVAQGVSLQVAPASTYCLLGPNGAGKTTVFRLLTGDLQADEGSISIGGFSQDLKSLYESGICGFCPQFDALLPGITVDEHLAAAAQIKGLAAHEGIHTGNLLKSVLGLDPHSQKSPIQLSGGSKRKLSVALAVIGCPKVLFLDEPTTGVDPASRRLIWTLLKPALEVAKNDGGASPSALRAKVGLPATLLTTHYMDEASILADRIGIMVNGVVLSEGSVSELYFKHCAVFSAEVTFTAMVAPQLQEYLNDKCKLGCSLVESVGRRVKFSIPRHLHTPKSASSSSTLELATVFEALRGCQSILPHYPVLLSDTHDARADFS